MPYKDNKSGASSPFPSVTTRQTLWGREVTTYNPETGAMEAQGYGEVLQQQADKAFSEGTAKGEK